MRKYNVTYILFSKFELRNKFLNQLYFEKEKENWYCPGLAGLGVTKIGQLVTYCQERGRVRKREDKIGRKRNREEDRGKEQKRERESMRVYEKLWESKTNE